MSLPEILIRRRRVNEIVVPPPKPQIIVPPVAPAARALGDAVAPPPVIVPPPAPVLSGTMAVPGITGVDVPVETDRTLPPGDVSRAITVPLPRGGASRPRYALEEPDVLTRSAETINYHQNRPLGRMGKGSSFLRMTLSKLGEGMAAAQAQANAQGRPVEWKDVLTGATYALGAGAGAAIDRTAVDRMRREGEVAGEQQYYGQELQRRGAVAKLADQTSQTRQRDAQTKYTLQRPLIEQAKLKFGYDKLGLDALHRERQAIASMFNRLLEFDPDAPANAEMVERMHALDFPVVKKTRGQKIQFIQDQRTGEWGVISADTTTGAATGATVTDGAGKPMITVPKPVMAAEEGVRNREFKAAENEKTRENQRGIAAGRNQTSVAVAGMRGGRTVAANSRAAKLADDFAREKQLSYSAPSDKERKKHAANAQAIGATLRDNHGYEFGQDAQGNPYIKPRVSAVTTGGAYAGRKMSRANISAARQALGVATDEEAERILRSQGAEIIP